ncbi:MAG: hypothetical protein JAZ02_08165 [Candidatus Thiodiazotropha endolucinida]|nr:hypothetical protein [Candidatus Thiodiazotropha endolucinida]
MADAKAGNFLQAVYANSSSSRDQRNKLASEVAMLHNEGLVDVVAAFQDLKHNTTNGVDFFLTRHVFENALPYLDAPVGTVMPCVLSLCREAGQDLAAGTILDGYIKFCEKDPMRARDALCLIEEDPATLADMLTATVVAGSKFDYPYYVTELVRLISHADTELRRNAVFTLAKIHWPEGERVPDNVIAVIAETVLTETDDRIVANTVRAAFALFKQDKRLEEWTVELISAALTKGDEHTLHAASDLFWLDTKELPQSLLEVLLAHLRRVKSENTGTLNNIDYGLAYLLKHTDPERALRFLEELLTTHGDQLDINALDSTAGEIRENAALISKILTRWLLRGERELCSAVHEIVGTHHGDDLRVEIDSSELKPADHVHIIFIAHKAIGYFFMKPVTAASVIISLMRSTSHNETLNALSELLFDPLLLNYPGGVSDYLKEATEHETGLIKNSIEHALDSMEQYLNVLREVPELPALYPSESQRESYRRHMNESMTKSMAAAEKKSVLSGLFSRSTLLYGNKSINYINTGNGDPRRMEIPLTNHGISMEFPRMDNIDPYGLDHMLRVFRVEQFRK